MPEHCRECTTLGNGPCDCARLLAERSAYDGVAKPLLRSALGERWMGMEDIAQPWKPVRVQRLDNENKALMKMRDTHIKMVAEIDKKIADNNAEIQREYSHGARDAESAL